MESTHKESIMNLMVQILVGGLTGWLVGKAVEVEGRVRVISEGHLLDVIYGIIGAMIGNIYFSGLSWEKVMRLVLIQ
jgi:uncharacterized membrane protein YeaQ/YmgE (transglycosylase-associated protein family)